MSNTLYYTGEINRVEKEWFPTFNKVLYQRHLEDKLDVKLVIPHSHFHRYHVVDIPELDYDVYVHANISFLIDVERKRAICLNTYWNIIEIFEANQKLFEDFDVILYCGHYYQPDIDIVIQKVKNKKTLNKNYELRPWIFRPLLWSLPEYEYKPENKNLFFRGLNLAQRKFIDIIESKNLDGFDVSLNSRVQTDLYHETCSKNLACLSTVGARDMCNRDIELFSMGIPVIRTKFFSKLINVDIPNDVYIPIEFEQITKDQRFLGMPKNHEKVADDVIYLWNQIKEDSNYLNKIGQNAKDFYNEFFTNEKLVDFTYKTITEELQKWE
jgi:hypothetical protein